MATIARSAGIVEDAHLTTLYYWLHCQWCDQPTGAPHLAFCKDGRGVDWPRLRRHILARDGYRCCYCGWESEGASDDWLLHIDHVRPRSAGGRDVPWNLVTACWRCNGAKGAKIHRWLVKWEADRCDHEAAVEAAYWADLGAFD